MAAMTSPANKELQQMLILFPLSEQQVRIFLVPESN